MPPGAPATPHRGTEASPAIDRSVLGEWLAGDEAAIDTLLAVFRDSTRAEQARMISALAAGDLDGYAKSAHRLRGAALSMGARPLADAAGTLYTAARARDAAACAGGMALLEARMRAMADEVPATAATRDDGTPAGA